MKEIHEQGKKYNSPIHSLYRFIQELPASSGFTTPFRFSNVCTWFFIDVSFFPKSSLARAVSRSSRVCWSGIQISGSSFPTRTCARNISNIRLASFSSAFFFLSLVALAIFVGANMWDSMPAWTKPLSQTSKSRLYKQLWSLPHHALQPNISNKNQPLPSMQSILNSSYLRRLTTNPNTKRQGVVVCINPGWRTDSYYKITLWQSLLVAALGWDM